MTVKSFTKLVEIQTKVASVIPFTLGTFYALYSFKSFNTKNFLLMLIALLCIDMATTAINNYIDYKSAIKTEGYNYESHNAIVSYNLKESSVVITIISLLIIASISGLLLFINTNILVLLIGMASFLVGILYSFGPLPISRTPLGEIFSGFFMGFVIFFLAVYIHIFGQNIVDLTLAYGKLSLVIKVLPTIIIFLISIPLINGIANIMLANNICDIEDDISNNRHTLAIYLGKKRALRLFSALYYLAYLDLILLVLLKAVPIISLITLITIIPVTKNLKLFYKLQTKKDTFMLAVKNFLLINIMYILSFVLALIFHL